ncbi:helix-turn-helix domain-containing protein [Streptomyces samsunensis]|uniref:Helix-turn-helix domain-containing protein n=2 Tax=Streptomyces malaysiensis TaxID=92644 RepID=A0A9X2RXZ3_STRMQ|nr:helix-turn-helix domain-containing protein [Streptomyces samsunensis]
MRADGAVVSGEELLARVWGGEVGARSNAVRIAVSRLRAKLGRPAVVETVPRWGYRLRHADRSAEGRSLAARSSEGRSLAAPRSSEERSPGRDGCRNRRGAR